MGDTAIPKRNSNETLLEYSARLARLYSEQQGLESRKSKGQFFTPKSVSEFMAGLVDLDKDVFRLLDLGAGTGILLAGVCERILTEKTKLKTIQIDAYENDPEILPFLERTLKSCENKLKSKGHCFSYKILDQDFILENAHRFGQMTFEHTHNKNFSKYDCVISNPPYYKLNKESPQAKAMSGLVYGQPNLYALFMALAVCMLDKHGDMIFITPRSFCSGLYYRRLRNWIIENTLIEHIHIFESRKHIFDEDDVLQENIILKSRRNGQDKTKEITITTSRDKTFDRTKTIKATYKDIHYQKNGDTFIRIPSSQSELEIVRAIDEWRHTINGLGIEISTGPVVAFRATHFIKRAFNKNEDVPLLWMHNLKHWEVEWPIQNPKKEEAIKLKAKDKRLLLGVKNYVLIKRFTSKEQKRRLSAAVLQKSKFENYTYIGIENHLNYVHKPKGELTEEEAYGIAALLNTSIIDKYFRALNGNTQVNAVDIRSLPLPDMEIIKKAGVQVKDKMPDIGSELDGVVAVALGIDSELFDKANQD